MGWGILDDRGGCREYGECFESLVEAFRVAELCDDLADPGLEPSGV